jgi:predicted ArsR family transcriptional regulator
MTDDRPGRELAALAALAEPIRRRLYLHVAAQPSPVSRDDAATAIGVPRSVAAFHLDKLTDAGLLEVDYRRPPGRGGPGAGRPAKLYRRAAAELTFSVPERHYDLVARLLAAALAKPGRGGVGGGGTSHSRETLGSIARDYGRTVGEGAGPSKRTGRRARLARLVDTLVGQGYEPTVAGSEVSLCNCPFRAVADLQPELVCTMNLDLIEGLLEAIGDPSLSARLDPAEGRCCVTLDIS